MICIESESILSMSEAARFLGRARQGKRPHVATLYRWASAGLKGHVLETIQVGGTRCTSKEALQRLFVALSASPPPATERGDASKLRTEEALRELGIL